jgi:ribosomal protein S18 acetylase RimI-like enzyme
MSVRLATAEDAAAIAGIHVRTWRAAYRDILPPATLAALDESRRAQLWRCRVTAPDPRHRVLVAVDGAGVVGFLYLGPTGDPDDDADAVGQVLALHVDPDAGGRGIGRALLRRAVDEFTRSGYRTATLWVVEGNVGARRFYERAGWSTDGASRREPLAAEGETGDLVTVVRYRVGLVLGV